MDLAGFLPFFSKLDKAQQEWLTNSVETMTVKAGTVVQNGSLD